MYVPTGFLVALVYITTGECSRFSLKNEASYFLLHGHFSLSRQQISVLITPVLAIEAASPI